MKTELLEETIRHHQECYDAGAPELEDFAFDALVEQLRAQCPSSPVLQELTPNRPNEPVKHTTPMLSLEKTYDAESLSAFARKVDFGDDEWPVVIQPKYDGVACSLRYRNGRLISAATRGDGHIGENITTAVTKASSDAHFLLPKDFWSSEDIEVRGELVMSVESFDRKWRAQGMKNPRNTVAGILARKGNDWHIDPGEIDFVAYDLVDPSSSASQVNRLSTLFDMGFRVAECVAANAATVVGMVKEIATAPRGMRADCAYELDGLVIKANSKTAETLGCTAHHPKWAIAYKFATSAQTTTLRSVEWAVSRLGTITPVAVMDPVELSGATVTRATLHSLSRVRSLNLRIGATLEVVRRGGVIPHVNSATGGDVLVEPPAVCPTCGTKTHESNHKISCLSHTCPGVQTEVILHWCATTGMLGWGPEIVSQLLQKRLVLATPHIYKLTAAQLTQAGFGALTANGLLLAVEAARTLTPEVFLAALGIPGLGLEGARDLVQQVPWREFVVFPHEHLQRLEQRKILTATRANSLLREFKVRQDLIDELLACVFVKDDQSVVTGKRFSGKNVVFTGALADMERGVAQELVRAQGGRTPSSVTKQTHVLVVGELAPGEQTIKLEKAKKYGIEIMDGEAFALALSENG